MLVRQASLIEVRPAAAFTRCNEQIQHYLIETDSAVAQYQPQLGPDISLNLETKLC